MWYVDLELWSIYLLLAAAIGVACWSACRHGVSFRAPLHHGVAARKIAVGTWAVALVCLLLCFALGSTEPLMSNGAKFDDALWLRLADMFINGGLLLIVAAAVCVGYNYLKRFRDAQAKE